MSYNPATLQPPARNSKRLFRFFAGLCVALAAGCSSVRDTSQTFATVVIDPGHGGKDSGTHSKRGGLEKDNALDVALHVNQDLRRAGFHTVMTRTDDTFIPLNERAAISNEQQNAIFVSIHFNDSRNHGIHGVEAYYNSNPAAQLADRVEGQLAQMSPIRFKKFASFRVLRLNQYPAILVECGYLSNNAEASLCSNPEYREKLADRIAQGIIEQRYGEEAAQRLVRAPAVAPQLSAAGKAAAIRASWSPETITH